MTIFQVCLLACWKRDTKFKLQWLYFCFPVKLFFFLNSNLSKLYVPFCLPFKLNSTKGFNLKQILCIKKKFYLNFKHEKQRLREHIQFGIKSRNATKKLGSEDVNLNTTTTELIF